MTQKPTSARMWVFYLVVLKPTCCAGGIVKRCLWSEYAAVIFGMTTAQQNPPRSPFRKGGPRGILFTGMAFVLAKVLLSESPLRGRHPFGLGHGPKPPPASGG